MSRHTTNAISAILLLAAAPCAVSAQEPLNKEITVDKEMVPHQREASRLILTPELRLPPVKAKKLQWNASPVDAPLTDTVATLQPTAYRASVAPSPYRGYVSAGYFPTFQLGVSAGYRIVDTSASRLAAWLQYDGDSYKGRAEVAPSEKLRHNFHTHTGSIGLRGSHTWQGTGTIAAALAYTGSAYNSPLYTLTTPRPEYDGFSQTASLFRADLSWHGTAAAEALTYHVAADVTAFGFGKAIPFDGARAAASTDYSLSAGAAWAFTPHARIGADFSYDATRADAIADGGPSASFGVFTANPYFLLRHDNFAMRLGLRVDARTADQKSTCLNPDVYLSFTPSTTVTIWAGVTGGQVDLNSASRLWQRNRYASPSAIYTPTRMKYDAEAGVRFGPFSGFSIESWARYANVRSWLSPTVCTTAGDPYVIPGTFDPVSEFKSLLIGGAVEYSYLHVARLRVEYQAAPGKEYDEGCHLWDDRAEGQLKATLSIAPVEPLDITLGYTLRTSRAYYRLEDVEMAEGITLTAHERNPLGDVSSLDLSASYRLNRRLTLRADVENLLDSRWQMQYGIPSRGITGLVGATFLF